MLFLVTTVLTNVTGFMFPAATVTPAQIVGGISLATLAGALVALFVGVVQAFQKVPLLHTLAPNGRTAFHHRPNNHAADLWGSRDLGSEAISPVPRLKRRSEWLPENVMSSKNPKKIRVELYRGPVGGWGSVRGVMEILLREAIPLKGSLALWHQNKPGGFACVSLLLWSSSGPQCV